MSLLIVFIVIKALPPLLSWFIIDANIAGDSKDVCTGTGACWTYIKVWFKRFMYGMYPNELHWRINSAFLLVIGLGFVGYFLQQESNGRRCPDAESAVRAEAGATSDEREPRLLQM